MKNPFVAAAVAALANSTAASEGIAAQLGIAVSATRSRSRDRTPNKHEDTDPNFGNKLARKAAKHMITKRNHNGQSGGKGNRSVYPPIVPNVMYFTHARGKYMPHQGAQECARRIAPPLYAQ